MSDQANHEDNLSLLDLEIAADAGAHFLDPGVTSTPRQSPHQPSPVVGPSPDRSIPGWPTDPTSDIQNMLRGIHNFGDVIARAITEASKNNRESASPPAESREHEPKANPPAEFDGSARRKLEPFIAECEIMFATAPRRYRTESAKVHSAGSYLKGDPKKWFSNFFLLPPEKRPLWFLSWSDFKEELRSTWGLEDPEGAAKEELRRLKMSDKDRVPYFTSRFRAIPSWADRNFRNTYYAALAPRIRTQFVTAGRAPPTKLDELIKAAESFDRAYWTDVELNRSLQPSDKSPSSTAKPTSDSNKQKSNTNSSTTSTNTSKSQTTTAKTDDKKHLGPDGKLTPEERKRRLDNGLCLFCGQGKHLSANCPRKEKRGTQHTQDQQSKTTLARATITVLPDEEATTTE